MPRLAGPFRFDRDAHRYTVGAVEVPGLHGVLRAGGVERDLSWLDPIYRARGKAVHAAALAYDMGDDVVLRAEWRPFFDAYLKLLSTVACRWRLLEQPRVHRTLRFATMLDRVGTVNGRAAVVELKTGSPDAFHGPQLAGADLLLPGGGVNSPRRRLGFYLGSDGRFIIREYRAAADYLTFRASLAKYWEGADDGTH